MYNYTYKYMCKTTVLYTTQNNTHWHKMSIISCLKFNRANHDLSKPNDLYFNLNCNIYGNISKLAYFRTKTETKEQNTTAKILTKMLDSPK